MSATVAIREGRPATELGARWAQAADFCGPMVAGLLLACAARFEAMSWLVWVALVPLLVALRAGRGYFILGVGSFFGGLVYSLLALDWIRTADGSDDFTQRLHEWFLLSQLYAVVWPLAALTAQWLWINRGITPGLGFCLTWVVAEFTRHVVSSSIDGIGFPWLYLAQLPGIPLVVAQVGDLAGMQAIAVCVVGANGVIASIAVAIISAARRRSRKTMGPSAAVAAAGIVSVLVYGAVRLQQSSSETGPEVVAMPSSTMWESPPMSPRDAGEQRTSEIHQKRPLFVWPECAYRSYLFGDTSPDKGTNTAGSLRLVKVKSNESRITAAVDSNLAQIRGWSERLNATLVVGCVRQEYRDGVWRWFNCALVLAPGDSWPRYYDKVALVPGTEGAPRLGGLFGYDTLATFKRGEGFPVFSAEESLESTYRFGVAICYDICFPQIFREYFSSPSPPEFFVVPGSEAVDRTGHLQKLLMRMAQLRAIEVRRPIVRCVDQGYSCLIDGSGRIVSVADGLTLSSPCRLGDFPLDQRTSLYALWGDWLPMAATVLLAAIVAWRRRPAVAHSVLGVRN